MSEITFDDALNMVLQLPLSDQETLVELMRRKHIEARRQEIATDHHEAMTLYRSGALQGQTADELICELR